MATYIIACSFGGKAIHAYYRILAEELRARGNTVVLVYDRRRTDVEDHNADIPVYVWPSPRPTKLQDAVFLRRLIRAFKPDCIMASFGSVNLSMLIGWICRVPVRLAWLLTLSTQNARDGSLTRLQEIFLKRRKGLLFTISTNLITLTEALVEDAVAAYKANRTKMILVPYALPVPIVEDQVRKKNAIVSIGRMVPSKGQEFLVRAMPEILLHAPDTHLELIGDGPTLAGLKIITSELGIEKAVTFSGGMSYDYVLEAMATAAVVVSPSLNEAGGLINVEAQSVGTPVVASRVDGIQEIIIDGKTGFLVPPGEPEGIAEKIVQLLQDDALRAEFGRNGRAHYEKTHGRGNIAKHADVFESLVSAAKRR